MNKVLILEGPDGSGKTTLAQYFADIRGFQIIHTGKPEPGENLLVSYATVLNNAILSGKNVVFDRLQLGESIYGPIMRGHDQLGEEGQIILQRIVRAADVKQVICLPPYEVCLANWKKRHAREYVQDETIYGRIFEEYLLLASKPWLVASTGLYDYTLDKNPQNVEGAVFFYQGRRLPPEVIGSPTARFLFVGEIANQESLDLPWIDLGNSSHFLNTSLWAAGFREEEMAFTNVLRLNKTRRDIYAIRHQMAAGDTHHPVVVALGKNAAQHIAPGVATYTLDHPAYWKRFHSSEPKVYVELLRRIRTETYNAQRGSC